ncbi:MAG: dihydrofolate reductase family protein [Thermoproteota archaeon]|nr:dihydrofolate reductase family protein [Thermoproteota archaeon]
MRKLKLQVQLSVDSFIAGPNGEMDWMIWNWDDKLKNYVFELTDPVDTIILGRKMTDGFVSYWSDLLNKPDDPFYAFAKKMIETPKVVFTKTLKKSQWVNTDIATGDLTEEIMNLKTRNGKDIIVYGGASFDSSLIKEGLIDDFYLFINPAAIGKGMTIFKDLNEIQKFTLVKSVAFDCGIVLLHHEPKRA